MTGKKWGDSELPLIGLQVRFQIELFVCETEFFPDVFPVEFDSAQGEIQEFRHIFIGLAILDQIGYLNLPGGEIKIHG